VETAEGLRYRLDDGTEHRSPSSAGKAAMNGVRCNGWRFWSVERTETPQREPRAKADKPAKAKREAVAKKPAKTKAAAAPKTKAAPKKGKAPKKPKAQRAAAKSDASYGCGVCPETFPTMKAVAHALTHTS